MARRLTMGLYNSYDARSFHEAMRRAVVRAAPLAAAFDFHLALIGFPWQAYKDSDGKSPEMRTPQDVAQALARSTSIGEGGQYMVDLAADGGLHMAGFPERGFPPQWGTPVLATPSPDPAKRIDAHTLADRLATEPVLVIVGLGPRGVPKDIESICPLHLELTGKDFSLETATAMGVLAGRVAEALSKPRTPRVSVDAFVRRGSSVLLVRRARPPFEGSWVLPGGFVDADESTPKAVLRELEEETGLVGKVSRVVGVYSEPGRDPRGATVTIVYEVIVPPEARPAAGDDAAEAAFHEVSALPKLGFDHGRIMRDALGG